MKVIKRNGSTEEFTLDKIKVAISKAFVETKRNVIPDVLDMLALRTAADFDPKIKNDSIEVEQIQDSVEKVLSDSGYADVAKAYILYRKKHADLRNANEHMLNYKKLVEDYLQVADWRVKENSTVAYSLGGLILSNSGAVTANYWLDEVYDEEIRDAHKEAKIHIHDLSMLSGYCFTGDTRIKTLDGTNPTFKELVDSGVKEVSLYAYDIEAGKYVETKGENPRITRMIDKFIHVTLSNGETVKSTEDHRYLLATGEYKEANKLTVGEVIMSIGEEVTVTNTIIETLEEEIPVYDLTVPEYHNFALDCGVFVHNCAGWSLKQLIQEGLGGVPGKITSKPASHLSTLCNQMVNFLGIMQNCWAGQDCVPGINWVNA